MMTLATNVESLQPETLTRLLHEAGALPTGAVSAITRRRNAAFNSTITHLELIYDRNAPPEAPRHLVHKRNIDADWARRAGAREVAFYQLATQFAAFLPMLVACYAAEHDDATGNSYLLLHDVSPTHAAPLTREQTVAGVAMPTDMAITQVVEALAQFHGYWWEHPTLGQGVAQVDPWFADRLQYEQITMRLAAAWEQLIAAEGDWFPAHLREVYTEAARQMPKAWQLYEDRLRRLTKLTLTHGDSYFANFLCPIGPSAGPTYLIDWQSPWVLWGAADLVPLCAAFWTQAQRQDERREERMIRHYYRTLSTAGVANYSWEELLYDYRLGLLYWLFVPVQDRAEGSAKEYWWPKLQCLCSAYMDWNCAELLV